MSSIHLKTSLDHIRRAPFQALAAFFVLTITFFVITLLATFVYSSQNVLRYFETRPQIIAFLKTETTPEQAAILVDSLKGDSRVSKVNYVSKEDALEIYKKATSNNPLLTELVSPSIFPASIEISVTDLSYAEDIINEMKKSEIVDQVGFTASLNGEESLTSVVERLKNIAWYVRIGGTVAALILSGASFLILIVIIGMRMTTRRGEMEILDLIGATPAFIRIPIILEAVFYAVSGVVVGWLCAFLLVLYATPTLLNYFGDIPILPRETGQLMLLFGIILGGELVMGLFLAFTGSILAVSRVKKR
jgi:cell division transport system permease protein